MNNLETLLNCPVCGRKYSTKSAQIISARKRELLIHISCAYCKSASLAVVIQQGPAAEGMITMGTLTDLSVEEARALLGKGPISADEIIDFMEKERK